MDPKRIREGQKHIDPTDPDLQHWSFCWLCIRTKFQIFSFSFPGFSADFFHFFTSKFPTFLQAASNESSFHKRFRYQYRISLKRSTLSPKG
jgi:hypothetical protein